MSWDIHVQDLPKVQSIQDIPDDFVPQSLGFRSTVIAKIIEAIPFADFADPTWGRIDGDNWSIEVNLGREEECEGFMLHVRGGDGAVAAVQAIVDCLGVRAIDMQTGEFLDVEASAASLAEWRSYRDQVVRDT